MKIVRVSYVCVHVTKPTISNPTLSILNVELNTHQILIQIQSEKKYYAVTKNSFVYFYIRLPDCLNRSDRRLSNSNRE